MQVAVHRSDNNFPGPSFSGMPNPRSFPSLSTKQRLLGSKKSSLIESCVSLCKNHYFLLYMIVFGTSKHTSSFQVMFRMFTLSLSAAVVVVVFL